MGTLQLSTSARADQAAAVRRAIGDQAMAKAGAAMVSALRDVIDADGYGAALSIFDSPDLETCLARLPLPLPCGSIEGSTLVIGPIGPVDVVDGTATWGNIATASGEVVIDFDVGEGYATLALETCQLKSDSQLKITRLEIKPW